MARRWWLLVIIFLFLVVTTVGPAKAQEEEETAEWDSLEVYFFPDAEKVKIKIIEVPSGKVLEEQTEKIEDIDHGAAVAKKFPRTWVVFGPITMGAEEPAPTPDMQYYLKHFKLEYLGSVKVKVPETEIYTPETDEPEAESAFGPPHPIEEDWGGSDDGDDQNGDIEDDSDEPEGPPIQEVDAFLHIYKYKGKN